MSYSLISHEGQGVNVVINTGNLAGFSNLVVEYSRNSDFPSVVLSNSVTPEADNRSIILALSAADVTLLKDSYFRVKGDKGGVNTIVQFGSIDYTPSEAPASGGSTGPTYGLVWADALPITISTTIAAGTSRSFSVGLLKPLPSDGSTYEILTRLALVQGRTGFPLTQNVTIDANMSNIHFDVYSDTAFGNTTPIPIQSGVLHVFISRVPA